MSESSESSDSSDFQYSPGKSTRKRKKDKRKRKRRVDSINVDDIDISSIPRLPISPNRVPMGKPASFGPPPVAKRKTGRSKKQKQSTIDQFFAPPVPPPPFASTPVRTETSECETSHSEDSSSSSSSSSNLSDHRVSDSSGTPPLRSQVESAEVIPAEPDELEEPTSTLPPLWQPQNTADYHNYIDEKAIFKNLPNNLAESFQELMQREKKELQERLEAEEKQRGSHEVTFHMQRKAMKSTEQGRFPQDLQGFDDVYLCNHCITSYTSERICSRHMTRCLTDTMPGIEIYRDEARKLSVFEACGVRDRDFCRRLCRLGYCFISTKAMEYSVEPFYFYCLYYTDRNDKHNFCGYFSKQKYSHTDINLCCLLVMPCFQGKGYGRFLIEFSYLLSQVERMPGMPELPLSDTASVVYYKVIHEAFLEHTFTYLKEVQPQTSEWPRVIRFDVKRICLTSGIHLRDLVKVLMDQNKMDIKRDADGNIIQHTVMISANEIFKHMASDKCRLRLRVHKQHLKWKPRPKYSLDERLHFREIDKEYWTRKANGTINDNDQSVLVIDDDDQDEYQEDQEGDEDEETSQIMGRFSCNRQENDRLFQERVGSHLDKNRSQILGRRWEDDRTSYAGQVRKKGAPIRPPVVQKLSNYDELQRMTTEEFVEQALAKMYGPKQ